MVVAATVVVMAVNNTDITCSPVGIKELQGNHVMLVRSAPEYTDFIYECYQDDDFMDLYRLAQDRQLSKEQIRERLVDESSQLPQELSRIEWVVLKKLDNGDTIPVGIAALADYQTNHLRAEFLLGILDKHYRKGSLSIEASLLVLDFAFNQVGLNKVISFVYGYNDQAQKNTLHLGFKQEGLLEEHIQGRGGLIDLFQNAMLRSRFINNKQLSRFSLRLLGRDITKPSQFVVSSSSDELIAQLNKQLKVGQT